MISLVNVEKRYGFRGRVQAIKSFSLELDRHRPTVLLGPNGAGKSTLIRLILGLTRPTAGEVRWEGGRRPAVGYAPEHATLFPRATVAEAIRLWSGSRAAEERLRWLSALQLEAILGRGMGRLSKGEAQRVSLALAFVSGAGVVVLDEPFEGLDPLIRPVIRAAIASALRAQTAPTLLASTHRLEEVREPFERVLVLQHGHLIRDLTMQELDALRQGRIMVLQHSLPTEEIRRTVGPAGVNGVRAVRGFYRDEPVVLVGPYLPASAPRSGDAVDLESLLQLWLNPNLLEESR